MKKKKESNLRFFRFTARVWIISMPTALVLALLLLIGKISPLTALLCLFGVVAFTAVITGFVFRELEKFISYLKNLAQGEDTEPPRFRKGVFSSFRLADTFQSVRKIWFNQTLSEVSILERLPDSIIMLDDNGNIVFMNKKAQEVFGSKYMKQTAETLLTGSAFRHAVQSVLTEINATEWFEWQYESYFFQARIDRLPTPTRNKAIAVVILHDITPFKRFREKQSEFFANASHELKTPLSIISGFIETLQGPAKDDESARDKFLGMMAQQTNRMTGLVQDLLKLSRQQITQENEHNEVILLADLIQGVIDNLKLKAAQNDKEIILTKDCEIPRIIGNRMELNLVFQNLIDNAIKYGEKNSVIHVHLSLPDITVEQSEIHKQFVKISIHNQGTPIPPHHLDKLFDRFYRVDSVETKKIEGTGLGLGIAQQIVHEHDGTIDVASTKAEGTTFTVYLPLNL